MNGWIRPSSRFWLSSRRHRHPTSPPSTKRPPPLKPCPSLLLMPCPLTMSLTCSKTWSTESSCQTTQSQLSQCHNSQQLQQQLLSSQQQQQLLRNSLGDLGGKQAGLKWPLPPPQWQQGLTRGLPG